MNAIERGSTDSWTAHPRRIAAVQDALRGPGPGPGAGGAAANAGGAAEGDTPAPAGGGRGGRATKADFDRLMRAPELRDPRGYIIPADQPDFLTATKFVDALLETGITVHRAARAFDVNGRTYPAGSFIVKTAQAFAPHVFDMFEPQDHPDDIAYPGAAPTPPYDNAGWTLAYQMGVQFDRILEGFDGPFETVQGLRAPRPAGRVANNARAYLLSHQANDAFIAVNRLLAAGQQVFWLKQPLTANGKTYPAGTFYIHASRDTRPQLEKIARETGLTFEATSTRPAGEQYKLRPVRVALFDRYGGTMPSGWTRWVLEQFDFPYELVFPKALDAGNLNAKYDVIIFPDGSIPAAPPAAGGGGGGGGGGGNTANIPAEFQDRLGSVSVATTVPQLKAFMENGGTVITVGSSTSLAQHIGLPVTSALVETVDGAARAVPRSKFYVPGSVLRMEVDQTAPVMAGVPKNVDVFFDSSPVVRLGTNAGDFRLRSLGWFNENPLRSGWAWGQQYLTRGVEIAEADVGSGSLFLFAPEVTFRAQPHGTFKLLFYGIQLAGAESAKVP